MGTLQNNPILSTYVKPIRPHVAVVLAAVMLAVVAVVTRIAPPALLVGLVFATAIERAPRRA